MSSIIYPLTIKYLENFTDDTGLFQHAKYSIPDRHQGYATDDNARALVVVSKYYDLTKSEVAVKLARVYLSFLHYMKREDGLFYNKLSYDRCRKWEISEDCYGRVLWGLASLYSSKMPESLRLLADELFRDALRAISKINSLRGMALVIVGLYSYYKHTKDDFILDLITEFAWRIVDLYNDFADKNWKWFEDILTYENARIPEALYLAYKVTNERSFLEVAEESFNFLCRITIINDVFYPIGNKGWYKKNGERAYYDQQPIEAGSMTEAALTAFNVTGNIYYIKVAKIAFEWYFGRNSKSVKIYDEENGGCYDGITPQGLNRNQGAEATLSYLLARLKFEELELQRARPTITLPTKPILH